MIERGVVTGVKDEKLIVRVSRHPACGDCKVCAPAEEKRIDIELDNTVGAVEGDAVDIELEDAILKGALLFYAVPLTALLFGLFLGKVFTERIETAIPAEIICAASGIVAVIVSIGGIRRYAKVFKDKCRVKVLRIAEKIEGGK